MNNKLDNQSKILLATGYINYAASQINMVKLQSSGSPNKVLQEGVQQKEEMLKDISADLSEIVEKLGNYFNALDIVLPIDNKLHSSHMEVLLFGKDDVNCEY